MKSVIYLHGFNSSPDSHKARLTAKYFALHHPDISLHIPKLPPCPEEAIELLSTLIEGLGTENLLGLVGSSLGGYYSIFLKSQLPKKLKVVLINPAMRPFDLLQDYIGLNTNYYTGERYEVTSEHMAMLQRLYVPEEMLSLYDDSSCLLLTQTGDEVLDYRLATDALCHAKQWVQAGGDHAFQCYDAVLPMLAHFLEM